LRHGKDVTFTAVALVGEWMKCLRILNFQDKVQSGKQKKNTSLCREKPYTANDDATLEAHKAQTLAFIHHWDRNKMNKKHANATRKAKKEALRVIIIFHSQNIAFCSAQKANEKLERSSRFYRIIVSALEHYNGFKNNAWSSAYLQNNL
jgi:hypothetical protein